MLGYTESPARRALGISPREKSIPPLFRYVLKEDTYKDPVVPVLDNRDKFAWERHSPVMRPCNVDDLHYRLFAITEEDTLPDGQRDVLTCPGVDGMYITGRRGGQKARDTGPEESVLHKTPAVPEDAGPISRREKKQGWYSSRQGGG